MMITSGHEHRSIVKAKKISRYTIIVVKITELAFGTEYRRMWMLMGDADGEMRFLF